MAIDRRDFLKFVAGGAVGTIFTPLPWVSMDEVAKWSQRWAVIPEKGGASYVNSICRLCPGGCGLRVRLIEKKRAVKIEGHPHHPVNQGGLCPLGLAGLQYLYYDDIRLKGPLKRERARGSGKWKPVTWEEALSQISGKLKELRENSLSQTVAFVDGSGPGSQAELTALFLKAYGSPNYLRPFRSGDLEGVLTQTMHGLRAEMAYDLPAAGLILSFGTALLDGWGNPCWISQAFGQWRQGLPKGQARLVQIEPLASTTASLADEWLAIRPGSEGVLALSLAQVILAKGWYDKGSVTARISNPEGLKEILNKSYTPEQAAGKTDLSRETIERLAKDFASAPRPLALWGKGKGEIAVGLFEAQAVHLLNILTGSINRPGGVYLRPAFPSGLHAKPSRDGATEKGLAHPRIDGAFSKEYPITGQRTDHFFSGSQRPYPVNLLLINEANPAFSQGKEAFLKTVEQIPLVVSFSPFLDETSALADLVLPVPTFLERWDDGFGSPGVPFPVYGLTKPVLPPLHQAKSFGQTLLALAKSLGGPVQAALPFENMEEVLKQTAKVLYESKKGRLIDSPLPEPGKFQPASFESFDKFWGDLVLQGTWYQLENKGEKEKGKWDVSSASLRPPGQEKAVAGGKEALWLVPRSLMLLQSGAWANPPFLTKYLGEETLKQSNLVVQLNPQTALSLSVEEGDLVAIQSERGKIRGQVHIFEGARPGCLFVPLGLGHQAFGPTMKDRGANVYPILDWTVDQETGLTVAWVTKVRISKV